MIGFLVLLVFAWAAGSLLAVYFLVLAGLVVAVLLPLIFGGRAIRRIWAVYPTRRAARTLVVLAGMAAYAFGFLLWMGGSHRGTMIHLLVQTAVIAAVTAILVALVSIGQPGPYGLPQFDGQHTTPDSDPNIQYGPYENGRGGQWTNPPQTFQPAPPGGRRR